MIVNSGINQIYLNYQGSLESPSRLYGINLGPSTFPTFPRYLLDLKTGVFYFEIMNLGELTALKEEFLWPADYDIA